MDKKLYEGILEGIRNGLLEGLGDEPELRHTRRGRGRPRKSQKLSNLYRPVDNAPLSGMSPERVIQAFVNNVIQKIGAPLYMDNMCDVEKFRDAIVKGIDNAAKRYDIDPAQMKAEYNLTDLDSFAQDIRDNFDTLQHARNFPRSIQKVSPVVRRGRRGRRALTDEEVAQYKYYFQEFGHGTPVGESTLADLQELASYSLAKNGFVYEVVRPIREGMEDAPHLLYKRTAKFGENGENIVRQCYCYQCVYEYGVDVQYPWVSGKELHKYLRDEYDKL